MKLAISSSSFEGPLSRGDFTQLEWLEGTASTLGADGIVFDQRHFPRTDGDYLAQLKKVATDLGLIALALDVPSLFEEHGEKAREAAFATAAALGTLFVTTRLPARGEVPPAAFVAGVGAAKAAARAAKHANITVLVAPQAGSLAEDAGELRHFVKDVDSAWVGYMLPLGADRSSLGPRDRALVLSVGASDGLDFADIDDAARPWLLLEGDVGPARVAAVRAAAAKKTLARANVF